MMQQNKGEREEIMNTFGKAGSLKRRSDFSRSLVSPILISFVLYLFTFASNIFLASLSLSATAFFIGYRGSPPLRFAPGGRGGEGSSERKRLYDKTPH